MANHCFGMVRGKRLRFTELDICGNVTEDEAQMIVTDGFVEVTINGEYEDGAEIVQKNAWGAICVNEKLPDSLKYLTVDIEFCNVNPVLMSWIAGLRAYEGYGSDTIGFTVPEGELEAAVAFEMWTGLAGEGCDPDGGEASGYVLLPMLVGGKLDSWTVNGTDPSNFKVTGAYTRGGGAWGVGPYNIMMNEDADPGPTPDKLPTEIGADEHALFISTDLAPPPANCEPAVAVPAVT